MTKMVMVHANRVGAPKVTPTAVRRLVRAASQTGQSSTKLQNVTWSCQ
ncbi:TPA: hypothetical protein N0F65_007051 [Lagenidium giganteum]|uniref:Uncharacterized protein n=1 Tax=Lagenidium giganteum TaxID=4803 RepID=A0AAV2YV52_9STRA|nr:TPA: hypothetical protein N0F65_007051 [Lagenidium giganteum]